jgi:hypothetical protein
METGQVVQYGHEFIAGRRKGEAMRGAVKSGSYYYYYFTRGMEG